MSIGEHEKLCHSRFLLRICAYNLTMISRVTFRSALGPYIFGWGLVAFLLQKEIWVMEHEFKHMPPLIFISWLVYRLWGAKMAKSFEGEINEQLDDARETIVESKVANINAIEVSKAPFALKF